MIWRIIDATTLEVGDQPMAASEGNTLLNQVRESLLEEARQSSDLLSDLAGLEQYVAEAYNARAICELLQNADDAIASRFKILQSGGFVFVANDGRAFGREDLESLCRSAHSFKVRGASIGYRGIGFKSVVGLCHRVHLFSGQLEATFSRDRSLREVPGASRVPLIRIPHALLVQERVQVADVVAELKQEGFHTIFVLGDFAPRSLQVEVGSFDPSSLLFLRNIRQMEIGTDEDLLIKVSREPGDSGVRVVCLESRGRATSWKVIETEGAAVAFASTQTGAGRLAESEAIVHAFLPTYEPTGFPIKINGDVSTDPSRTRVVLDERTADCIERVAGLIVSLIDRTMNMRGTPLDAQALAALVPFSDPRVASFQRRSFKTDLLAAIRHASRGKFETLHCRPTWLNAIDFERLAEVSQLRTVPRAYGDVEGLGAFLRFLGAKEATLEDLSAGLSETPPSLVGAAEVAGYLARQHATKQIGTPAIDPSWRLWPASGVPRSLRHAKEAKDALDPSFVDLAAEKAGGIGQLKRLLSDLADATTALAMLPSEPVSVTVPSNSEGLGTRALGESPGNTPSPRFSLKRWRGAEQQLLTLLTAKGWKVTDVSRQNLGYDIEAFAPTEGDVCIEVKAIDYPGQPFTLTSNEEAVARQKGKSYLIAVVRQTESHLEVEFIADPTTRLKLLRQCRQWVWECATYGYNPERYPLE